MELTLGATKHYCGITLQSASGRRSAGRQQGLLSREMGLRGVALACDGVRTARFLAIVLLLMRLGMVLMWGLSAICVGVLVMGAMAAIASTETHALIRLMERSFVLHRHLVVRHH